MWGRNGGCDTVLALDIFPHHSFPENGVECARKQAHTKFQSGFKCQCLPQIQHYVAMLESGTQGAAATDLQR